MTAPLVSVKQVAEHLGDPNVAIFDCRFDLADQAAGFSAYLQGHIAGAHYADLERHLAGDKNGHNGRHPLPERAALTAFFRSHGVGLDTLVVAYDARDGMYAARLWWLLRWLGHGQVAVLDGGLAAWQEAGLALDSRPVTVATEGDLVDNAPLMRSVDVKAMLRREERGLIVIDARAGPRYRGEVEPIDPVPGHIPGAVNRPYTDNLDPSGHFLPAAELRSAFELLIGDHALDSVVNQCGSGVTACHNILAMDIAGLGDSLLYPGSWSEWCADPSRPVATGPAP